VSPEFWTNRRVLITGHTGFKGSWLSLLLRRLGAEVTGYALPPHTDPSLFESAGVADETTSILADIMDLRGLRTVVSNSRPDVVIHMAAQSLVPTGYAEPVETYAVNVMGTVHVLDAVREAPSVRAVVVVTSDKCYANQELARGYREDDPLGGDDPYSSSKGAAELVTAAYRQSFFLQGSTAIASARAGNVLGGGDWSEARLVPDVLRAAFGGGELVLRYPEAIRPWQHVLDPLNGYLMLAERLAAGHREACRAWNFGPDPADNRPVGEVVDQLVATIDRPISVRQGASPVNKESLTLLLDATAARTELGWAPCLDLETTLRWIAEWHRGFADGGSARDLTDTDIDRFLERAAR
jgi:CDP-glucose 4,6-dehydratase